MTLLLAVILVHGLHLSWGWDLLAVLRMDLARLGRPRPDGALTGDLRRRPAPPRPPLAPAGPVHGQSRRRASARSCVRRSRRICSTSASAEAQAEALLAAELHERLSRARCEAADP